MKFRPIDFTEAEKNGMIERSAPARIILETSPPSRRCDLRKGVVEEVLDTTAFKVGVNRPQGPSIA